jgi:hypothetical protein
VVSAIFYVACLMILFWSQKFSLVFCDFIAILFAAFGIFLANLDIHYSDFLSGVS